MSCEEFCDPHHPLIVHPKVPNWAVDGRVRQFKHLGFFDTLEVDHINVNNCLPLCYGYMTAKLR